jgi:nucleoid-associated protein YgaU
VSDSEYIEHVTVEGERWDQIADRYYGNPYQYEPIVRANPTVPISPSLAGGIVLRVPVLAADVTLAVDLPPWKR